MIEIPRLAFDRYTASSFHALRGTESVLAYYHQCLLKNKKLKNVTWGTLAKEIDDGIKNKTIKPGPPEELLINLNNLRKFYRNKTQHPVLKYSSDSSQDLISLCTKTINEIVQDLVDRKMHERWVFG